MGSPRRAGTPARARVHDERREQVHLGIHEVIDPSSDIEEGTEVEPDEVKAIAKHRNV